MDPIKPTFFGGILQISVVTNKGFQSVSLGVGGYAIQEEFFFLFVVGSAIWRGAQLELEQLLYCCMIISPGLPLAAKVVIFLETLW